MSEEIRQLVYPIGFISSLAFSLRFFVQWIYSERKKESVVPPSFWILSLIGNFFLFVHSAIQLQYPICVIQSLNAVISLRNLNLMGPKAKIWKFSTTLILMAVAFLLPTLGFWLGSPESWLRIPLHSFNHTLSVALSWHFIGALGVFLFALRFWLQWFEAETKGKSSLGKTFWWLSLIGACLSMVYFFFIGDLVNLLGPVFGVVPYLRNLILMKQKQAVYEL